jgi:hypothetical protein
MDYYQLIKNWHLKASQEEIFSNYVFEYLAFIGFLKRVKYTNKSKDVDAVRALKHDDNFKDLYLAEVDRNSHLANSWHLIIKELNRSRLGVVSKNSDEVESIQYWNCSHDEVGQRDHECEEQGRIKDLHDWNNMVEFWHSIRNNLFHAAKDPQDERDQILIENGYKTLSPLVQIMFDTRAI